MKMRLKLLAASLFAFFTASGQENPGTPLLKTILSHYYKNEKPIVKGRNQLLFLYCEKANNNEEIFETVNKIGLPPTEIKKIRQKVGSDIAAANWDAELQQVYASDKSRLSTKINACLTLEQYQEKQKKFNLNNQRLMIISKPVFYSNGNLALVKVVFYRSIEHNSGSVLLMEKTSTGWNIKEFLNPWST